VLRRAGGDKVRSLIATTKKKKKRLSKSGVGCWAGVCSSVPEPQPPPPPNKSGGQRFCRGRRAHSKVEMKNGENEDLVRVHVQL
jgi:hypothetical protein